MVALPNINIHEEMADMIAASRAFEANLSVVRNAVRWRCKPQHRQAMI